MDANCGFLNLTCTVSAARGSGGNPVKPDYYIEVWAVLALVIVAFIAGRLSVRRKADR